MQLLVMNLTDYQNSKNNLLVLNEKHFVVFNIISEIVEIHEIDAKQKKVAIKYERSISDEQEILIDGERVSQILQNIIRRVLDLASSDSKVVISPQLKQVTGEVGQLIVMITFKSDESKQEETKKMIE